MNGKRLGLSGVLVLSAALLLGVGYVQAQTPGTFCEFDANGMCVDSPIVDDGGNIGIGTTNAAFGKNPAFPARLTVVTPLDQVVVAFALLLGDVGGLHLTPLRVDGGVDVSFKTTAGSLAFEVVRFTHPTTSSPGKVGIWTSNPQFPHDVAGPSHATDFLVSSDARFKKDVRPLTNVLEKIEKIRGVAFDWNQRYEALGRATGKREIGVIAQDVEAVFPELVTTWGDEGYRAVDYGRLTSVLVEAVKEQQRQIKELRAEIEGLRAKLSGE